MDTIVVTNPEVHIQQAIEQAGVAEQTAVMLQDSFSPFFQQALQWKNQVEAIVVTDITQVDLMKQAREARLALKKIRVDADKKRKELKEDSLRYGKAVQGLYNIIEYLIVPLEQHAEAQEKFIEREQARLKAERKIQRETEISLFQEFVPRSVDLGALTDEEFATLYNGAKLQYEAKIEAEQRAEAERKAEEERKEKERIELEEKRKALEAEQARLKAEQARIEAERRIEQEKIEAERRKIEEERKAEQARIDAERRAEQERLVAERKAVEKKIEEEQLRLAAEKEKMRLEIEAEKARLMKSFEEAQTNDDEEEKSDAEVLADLANTFRSYRLPKVATKEASDTLKQVGVLLNKVATYIESRNK